MYYRKHQQLLQINKLSWQSVFALNGA